MDRKAQSQAAYALLLQGVSQARLEAHRIRHQVERALRLVENSEHKEHLYQVAGDMIISIPKRLDDLEVSLDRTGLALVKMSEEFLEARLPLDDKNLVEDTLTSAFGQSKFDQSVKKVTARYLREEDNWVKILSRIPVRSVQWSHGDKWIFPDGSYIYTWYVPKVKPDKLFVDLSNVREGARFRAMAFQFMHKHRHLTDGGSVMSPPDKVWVFEVVN
jgi:hypothetical protein